MLSIEQMRRKLMFDCPRYKSLGWQNRVSNMRPAQVVAIYNKFKRDGYFDEKRYLESINNDYYQMTIYDFLMEDDLK